MKVDREVGRGRFAKGTFDVTGNYDSDVRTGESGFTDADSARMNLHPSAEIESRGVDREQFVGAWNPECDIASQPIDFEHSVFQFGGFESHHTTEEPLEGAIECRGGSRCPGAPGFLGLILEVVAVALEFELRDCDA